MMILLNMQFFLQLINQTQNSKSIVQQVQFYQELKSDNKRSPNSRRGRSQAKLADLCSEDKQKIGQILQKLTQEAEDKKQLYDQLIKTQYHYEEKIDKLRKSSQDIYKDTRNLRKEYEEQIKQFEESTNQLKSRSMRLSQNFSKGDSKNNGNDQIKKTIELIHQIKQQNPEQSQIQQQFLRESDDFQLSQTKPNSLYKQIVTEESEYKGNDILKLSDIKSSGKFQEGQLLKYSQNSNTYHNQQVNYHYEDKMNYPSNRQYKNHSVHIQSNGEQIANEMSELLHNHPQTSRHRNYSAHQKSQNFNTPSTLEASASQNDLKESKISMKKKEIIQLKDEIDYLAQSLKTMGKRAKRSSKKERETPSKIKLTTQEDSKFVSPNFKPLIGNGQIDTEAKKNIKEDQRLTSQSSYIQNTEQEQETFYYKENEDKKMKDDNFKFNKINNILFNDQNAQKKTSSSMAPSARQQMGKQKNDTIEDAKSDILKSRRLIEQMKQSQLQTEDIDYDQYNVNDSELKLSNLHLNNSFQSTSRNPVMTCSNSKQKEKEDQQIQKNSYYTLPSSTQNKDSVKNLVENLTPEQMLQLKQQIDQKLSEKGSLQYEKQSQYQKSKSIKESEGRNKSPSPFISKIKQFLQIKERIIGENKSLKQSINQKSQDNIKEYEQSRQLKESKQNIKKQLIDEFKTVQQEEQYLILHKKSSRQNENQQNCKSSGVLKFTHLDENPHYFGSTQNISRYMERKGNGPSMTQNESISVNQNNYTSYVNEMESYSTNPTQYNVCQNNSRNFVSSQQIQKNLHSKSMINTQIPYSIQLSENELTQNLQDQRNQQNINKQEQVHQQAYVQTPVNTSIINENKNCFDTFCMNDSFNNRSFQQNLKSNVHSKNDNILDFYQSEQQKLYQQPYWQAQNISQNSYKQYQSNQILQQQEAQNTIKTNVYTYNVINSQPNITPQNNNQQTLPKQVAQSKYKLEDNSMKENNQIYSNLMQDQGLVKKKMCDEYESEIVDLLNDGEYRKREKSPKQINTYKKPKSLERQALHSQFVQNFLISNDSKVETQDLLQRYNKLVGQISEKLKAKELDKKIQQTKKKSNYSNKLSFKC